MADNLQKILGSLILDNWAMCLVISAVLLVLAARWRKTEAVRFWAIAHGLSLLPVLAGKPLLGIAAPHFPEEAALAVQIGITLLAAVPYVVTVFVLSWLVTEPSGRFPLLLPLICVPLCIGPLLVVRPIGDRCMFPGYLLLMLFTVGLLDLLRIRGPFPTEKKALTVLTVVLALQMVHLFGVYSPIHARNQAMNAYARIQSEAGATVIRITDLSEDGYVHCSYPYNEIWWNRYCLYYGLNTDTYFELVPQEEFMAEAREVLGR